jgi:hypothetical protein
MGRELKWIMKFFMHALNATTYKNPSCIDFRTTIKHDGCGTTFEWNYELPFL